MSEEERYTQKKCLICEEFKILKDNICMDCDGGDEYVNKVYKFLRSVETKTLIEKSVEKLIDIILAHEEKGWVIMFPIQQGRYTGNMGDMFPIGWHYKAVIARDKNYKEKNEK